MAGSLFKYSRLVFGILSAFSVVSWVNLLCVLCVCALVVSRYKYKG